MKTAFDHLVLVPTLFSSEWPTIVVLLVSTAIFVSIIWLTFRKQRYTSLRPACLAASFLPFLATFACSLLTLNQRIFKSASLANSLTAARDNFEHAKIASALTVVSVMVSAVCVIFALTLLLGRPAVPDKDHRG